MKNNDDELDTALILTHPFERFGANEDEIEFMLEHHEDQYDDVFYIGQSTGRIPTMVDIVSSLEDENRRSKLPPGHGDGHYEDGLEETTWGSLHDYTAHELLMDYDEIAVGGASRESCVKNTFDSLDEVRKTSELYSTTELYVDDDFTYTNSDHTKKIV